MAVLSAEDRAFWEEYGYVVVRDAVPPENCVAAARAVWEFLEMDPENPASWYPDPARRTIMVEIYQHQALWDNRQFPRVHQAFAEIWGTERLWVSFDRASMNPPERPDWAFPGPHLHWDMKLEMPVTLKVQGVLYLTDTPAEQGAFTCIPGFQQKLEPWLQALPPDADPRKVIREAAAEARPIGGKAGDLVIWHSALPHGSRPNTAERPRMAQYITDGDPQAGAHRRSPDTPRQSEKPGEQCAAKLPLALLRVIRAAHQGLRDQGRLLRVVGHEARVSEQIVTLHATEAARDRGGGQSLTRQPQGVTQRGSQQRSGKSVAHASSSILGR